MLELDPESTAWLDPALPATYQVIEAALAEIADVFPGLYIFIGADEPLGMPDELYDEYVRHVHAFVRSIGKRTWGFKSRCAPASIETTSSCIGFLKATWEAVRSRCLSNSWL